MRNYILIILSALMISCTNTETGSKSDSSVENTNDTNETNANVYKITEDSNMIDASKYLSEEELLFLKRMLLISYKKEDSKLLQDSYIDYDDLFGFGKDVSDPSFDVDLETRDEIYKEYEIFCNLVSKVFPIYKSVSKDLYKQKMRDVFGYRNDDNLRYDKDRQFLKDPRFLIDAIPSFDESKYTLDYSKGSDFFHIHGNYYPCMSVVFIHEKCMVVPITIHIHKAMYFDLINNNVEYQWTNEPGGLLTKKYSNPQEVFYARNHIYEECMKKGKVYIDKNILEIIFHYNNYVFQESKSSLNWLLADEWGGEVINDLFAIYNYDKDTTINKMFLKKIKTECFDNEGYKGNRITVDGNTDMYGNRVCNENMLRYLSENCYDPKDIDEYGLVKCDIVQYMQDCARLYFPKSNEEFIKDDFVSNHPLRHSVIWAYYLIHAYDLYIEKTGAAPRCWLKYFETSLYDSKNDCESLFYKKIKEDKFYGFDFAERCQSLYESFRQDYLIAQSRNEE